MADDHWRTLADWIVTRLRQWRFGHALGASPRHDVAVDLTLALAELRQRNVTVPSPLRLPTPSEVEHAQRQLGVAFPNDYRRYLLEASDVVFGTLEPCVVIPGMGYLDLVETARRAWQSGVPADVLAICEDNGDYFCLDDGRVVYWSHDGPTNESWPDLATWILEVWIGENE